MATDELSILREHLERYRGVTLQTLEMVPDDKLPWYPAVAQFSFAQQFFHIAQVEEYHAYGLFDGDWEEKRLDEPRQRLTRELLRRKLEETGRLFRDKLAALDPARLEEIVQVPHVPVAWPLRSWLWHSLEHEIHHKAQLAIYLRQIGVTPPFFAAVLPTGVRPDIR